MYEKVLNRFYSKRTSENIGIPSSEYSSGGLNKWIIPLNYGMPSEELFPMNEMLVAANRALEKNDKKVLQYGGGEGVQKLEKWILNKYSKYWDIEKWEDDVLVTYGASQAIDLIARTFIDEDDEVWLEAPTYFGALYILSSYKAKLKEFPVDSEGVDVDQIEKELAARYKSGGKMPKLFYAIPTFQNPTGTTLSIERRKKLSELAVRYNFLIIEDDCYSDISFSNDTYLPIKAFGLERTIYISTFSKVFSPGVRMGWIIAHNSIIQELKKQKPDGGTSGLTQEIMACLLEDIDYTHHINLLKNSYKKKKEIMENALNTYFPKCVNWISPKGGFYIWITLPENMDANEIVNLSLEKRVNFVPGSYFYIDDKGRNQLRLSYAYCSESSIETGIKRLGEVIRSQFVKD